MTGRLSLPELYDRLKEFVSQKIRTCRYGNQVLENWDEDLSRRDFKKCDLKWEGFCMTLDEVQEACLDTTLQYASAVLAS